MPLSHSELEALSTIDIRHPIPDAQLSAALASPPFLPPRALVNARDLGAVPGSALPRGRFYRCGNLGGVGSDDDDDAVAWLAANVRRVFDLRKPAERERVPDPAVDGVENVWLELDGVYPTPALEEFAVGDGSGVWREQYLVVLDMYAPVIRAILEHVRDRPTEPILFHCTAGRDRTGVVAGLLQNLAGTPPDAVVLDYMLSRVGIEAARPQLTEFALRSVGAADPAAPGFWNMASLRPSFWEAFAGGVGEVHGGWEGYVTGRLGFGEGELEVIKGNLRG